MRYRQLGDETASCDCESDNDEGRPCLNTIRPPSKYNRHDRSENVDGYREELRVCSRISKTVNNCGHSRCEARSVSVVAIGGD